MRFEILNKKSKVPLDEQYATDRWFILASIMVAIIGTVALSGHKAEAATTVDSVSAPSNATKNKPVEGYDSPQGYFTVIRHIYNDPNLRVSVFCKPDVKVVVTCQVYDMSLPYPRLIGVQYAITAKDYNSLPSQEKSNWYILDKNLLAKTQPQFPELTAQQVNVVLPHLLGNYAKLIITWNPLDNLPISADNHLRTENLQSLFVANSSSTNDPSTNK